MSFTVVVHDTERVFAGLDKNTIAKGTARGLTKMGRQARTAMRKRIRKVYTVKAAAVTKAITVSRATPARLVTTITASGRKVSMVKYQARETAKGARVKILRRKSPVLLKSMFIETAGSTTQVFYRPAAYAKNAHPGAGRKANKTTGSRRGARGQELPIHAFKGPAIPQLFGSRASFTDLQRFVGRKIDKLIAHEVMFEIDKKRVRR